MNAIIGFSQLLEPYMTDENSKLYMSIIQKSNKQLLQLINDIIDLSKIESNQLEILNKPFKLSDFINNIYVKYSKLLSENTNSVEFILKFPAEMKGEIINTDELRLQQILDNLLSNAIKFTKQGYIKLEVQKGNKCYIFRVEDTGIGISKENQELIFKQFRQEDTSIVREYGGAGLGLTISKLLSNLLGGDIKLSSEKGKGSIFTVEIPFLG
jgi:signal transduction histidine kinase